MVRINYVLVYFSIIVHITFVEILFYFVFSVMKDHCSEQKKCNLLSIFIEFMVFVQKSYLDRVFVVMYTKCL